MDVSLVMFKADGSRRDFPMKKPRVVLGRKNDCDLRIPLTSVSRQHCELEVADEQVKLRDLGSSNGTYHNNIRVQEAVLSPGDEIVVGPVVFTVVVDGEPGDIKPVRTIVGNGSASGTAVAESVTESGAESGSAEIVPDHEEDVPAEIEADESTPTVDLDDPIAALSDMDEDDDSDDDLIDSGELQIILDDDDEEEDK